MNDAPINESQRASRRREMWIGLFLVLVTAGVYWPVRNFDFINMDDWSYVTRNPVIQNGLSWENFKWAFQNIYATNWHPFTALSHMLDCQLFGLNAGAHHLTNLFFHLLNTLLLFALLKRLTGAFWRSAIVAALFALHPLHVESVAWVSERKDVLSGFFFLLTLWAYAHYTEKQKRKGEDERSAHPNFLAHPLSHSLTYYSLALIFFTLGLLSKPMLVTLPFVLLLVDYWPLQRISHFTFHNARSLLVEKIPFFALAIASSAVTFFVQKSEGAVMAFEKLPLGPRLANAFVAYVRYLAKTIWPDSLAPFYTYEVNLPAWQIFAAVVLLAGITAVTILLIRRSQYLFVGWFWFLGMFVPVIGLVQVGSQSMADRYTYLPHIGLFIALVWGVSELFKKWPGQIILSPPVAIIALVGCVVTASLQVRHWQNSESLFRHAINVTRDNYPAYNNLGAALDELGRYDEAETYFQKALEIKPDYIEVNFNLAPYRLRKGDLERAKEHLQLVLARSPNHAKAHYNLANILYRENNVAEAASHYAAALQSDPDYAKAHNNFGGLLLILGRHDEAISHFRAALQSDPDSVDVLNNLAGALIESGQPREALPLLSRTLQIDPGFADAHFNLGGALLALGELREATEQFAVALKINPNMAMAHCKSGEAFFRAGKTDEALAQYRAALKLDPDLPGAQYQAAAILSEEKKFALAIAHFKEAIRLKPDWIEPLNNLAWILATSSDAKYRDGKPAVEFAKRAVVLTENKNAGALDTLAAAYAQDGQFSNALATAKTAVEVAAAAGEKEIAEQIRARMELYRAGKTFHE